MVDPVPPFGRWAVEKMKTRDIHEVPTQPNNNTHKPTAKFIRCLSGSLGCWFGFLMILMFEFLRIPHNDCPYCPCLSPWKSIMANYDHGQFRTSICMCCFCFHSINFLWQKAVMCQTGWVDCY
jgi:hypothetical protein